MAWNTPRDWATNEAVTSANMDTYVSDNLTWLGTSRPHGRATDASFSHTSSNSWLSPAWSTVNTSVGGAVFSAGNGYFTALTAGFYLLGADGTYAANATGARGIMLSSAANGGGTVYAQNFSPSQSIAVASAVTTGIQLSAFQNVYVSLVQATGGTLTITDVHMWAIWETT